MIKKLAPLLAIGLAACSQADAGPPQIKVKFVTAKPVPECLTDEPQWIDPVKNKDETRSQATWRDHSNKGSFQSLSTDHATCKAALKAQQAKGK